jgi:peptidoglycan/xylan/chitin deacetylase (PgdA/CDA1 family)
VSSGANRVPTLLYHDVVAEDRAGDASGFPGGAAGLYKLTVSAFEQHLEALRSLGVGAPALATGRGGAFMLHFDDGGTSALELIAPRLEAVGWRGHFFVPTRYLGTSGFLDAEGVRELHRRGHVVGSHSWSHPERMADLPYRQIVEEWRRSRQDLEDIVGVSITIASVPGGFYSREVARAAGDAGVRILFNSEPVMTPEDIGGVEVWGRFNVNRRTPPSSAAGLVRGDVHLRASQYLLWNAKKVGKSFFGPVYRRVRELLLGP